MYIRYHPNTSSMDLTKNSKTIAVRTINGIGLILINILMMSIIGYLTLDSAANSNSRTGAYLLSILVPYFICSITKKMSGLERLLKFGHGFIFYIVFALIMIGIPIMLFTGLLPCLLIASGLLYTGNIVFGPLIGTHDTSSTD
jgi:hypothetical protein